MIGVFVPFLAAKDERERERERDNSFYNLQSAFNVCSGSVVECLTRDRGVAGLSFTD